MHLEMHEGGWVWYPTVHNYVHASHTQTCMYGCAG